MPERVGRRFFINTGVMRNDTVSHGELNAGLDPEISRKPRRESNTFLLHIAGF